MVQKRTQQIKAYKIDVARTSKDGSFKCPNCGMKMSPDDQSESNYGIHDVEMRNNELYEVIIYCKRCFSLIHLNGFLKIFKNYTKRTRLHQPYLERTEKVVQLLKILSYKKI